MMIENKDRQTHINIGGFNLENTSNAYEMCFISTVRY